MLDFLLDLTSAKQWCLQLESNVNMKSKALTLTVLFLLSCRFQQFRSESPETLYTMTTEQTRPPGAVVIDTRCFV